MKQKTAADWIRGNLDLMVLSALADGAKYGYLIQETLDRQSGGTLKIQAGTLYPLLHRLEADGLVRSRWDESTGRRRKWYDLTATGRQRLVHQARAWREYADVIWRMLSPVAGSASGSQGG